MIGSLLGGIAGLLIPGAGFLTSTIGSAVGGLLSGQSPKDAIKNSLIFGGVNYMFPGVANALQQSSIGKSATSALGNMGIGTNKGLAALANTAAPTASTSAASGIASAASKGPSVKQIYNYANLGSGIGSLLSQDKQGSTEPHPDYTGEIDRSEFTKNLYANKYTGERYDTVEERNDSERRHAENMGIGYARGGYIEGPGTGRSDDIPAQIYQDGVPVQEARLSDGEFVMTEQAVENGGGAAAMYARMKQLENGGPA